MTPKGKFGTGFGRWTTPFALSLGGLSVAMFALAGMFTLLALLVRGESLLGMVSLVSFLPFVAFPVVGTLIASRVPGNAVGWLCLVAGIFWMGIGLLEQFEAYRIAALGPEYFMEEYHGVSQGIWVVPVGLLGIYTLLLFPDGRLPSRRWRPLAWFSGLLMAVVAVGIVILPGPLIDRPSEDNPFGIESLGWATEYAIFVILLLPMCILASAVSLVFRFRRARNEVREQIKWLAFAGCFVGITYLGGLVAQVLVVPESFEIGGSEEPAWVSFVNGVTTASYAGVPVAVGIAVLKYRLYDIEVIINRALVYISLTAMLAATYFGSVVSLQYVFRAATGGESQIVVVASTLVIAALFVPLRRRIQSTVDRRFYRQKYDGRLILEAFSKRLRDETELDILSGDLVSVVSETVRPIHVSLWLRSFDRGER